LDKLREYTIKISQLEEKQYVHHFEDNDTFFRNFEQDTIAKSQFEVSLTLEKTALLIRMDFDIKGTLGLTCDRSLDQFDFPFRCQETLLIKFGEKYEEPSDELLILPFETAEFNVGQPVYEYIWLQVPIKKLHPRYRNLANEEDWDDEEAEGQVVYSTADHEPDPPATDVADAEASLLDPRWAALVKLKNNN
jgi:uncharacterized protein